MCLPFEVEYSMKVSRSIKYYSLPTRVYLWKLVTALKRFHNIGQKYLTTKLNVHVIINLVFIIYIWNKEVKKNYAQIICRELWSVDYMLLKELDNFCKKKTYIYLLFGCLPNQQFIYLLLKCPLQNCLKCWNFRQKFPISIEISVSIPN